MVNAPTVDASNYADEEFAVDSPTAAPKHGTSVQAGWGAAESKLTTKSSEYPNDFKFTKEPQLVRFLEDAPFAVYQQHWIEREGKKSFVCLEDECPLCIIAGDKPRGRFAFNVLVLSGEEQTVQILTAPPTFARMLRSANDDERRGPLTKHYWAISREGTGPQTTFNLERVRVTDLAEEWEMDAESVDVLAANAVKYDASTVYVSPKDEMTTIARSLINA
jgi:hypothetical protein